MCFPYQCPQRIIIVLLLPTGFPPCTVVVVDERKVQVVSLEFQAPTVFPGLLANACSTATSRLRNALDSIHVP